MARVHAVVHDIQAIELITKLRLAELYACVCVSEVSMLPHAHRTHSHRHNQQLSSNLKLSLKR